MVTDVDVDESQIIIVIIIYEFLVRLLQSEHRCITCSRTVKMSFSDKIEDVTIVDMTMTSTAGQVYLLFGRSLFTVRCETRRQ